MTARCPHCLRKARRNLIQGGAWCPTCLVAIPQSEIEAAEVRKAKRTAALDRIFAAHAETLKELADR